jgi:hypothetical protein
MSSQDTPGRPKSSASRQQTQPDQRTQSGSPELDAKDAGSEEAQRKNRSRPADEQEHEIAVPEPKDRRK